MQHKHTLTMARTKQKGNKTQARKSTAGEAPGKPGPAKAARKSTQVPRSNASQGHGLQCKVTGYDVTPESVAGKALKHHTFQALAGTTVAVRSVEARHQRVQGYSAALLPPAPLEALKLSVNVHIYKISISVSL